jgi:hypothetical protein
MNTEITRAGFIKQRERRGQGEKRPYLSVLAALFIHFRVFGFLETDESLERCGYLLDVSAGWHDPRNVATGGVMRGVRFSSGRWCGLFNILII